MLLSLLWPVQLLAISNNFQLDPFFFSHRNNRSEHSTCQGLWSVCFKERVWCGSYSGESHTRMLASRVCCSQLHFLLTVNRPQCTWMWNYRDVKIVCSSRYLNAISLMVKCGMINIPLNLYRNPMVYLSNIKSAIFWMHRINTDTIFDFQVFQWNYKYSEVRVQYKDW